MPASSRTSPTELSALIAGYRLCARTEGKSHKTIQAVAYVSNASLCIPLASDWAEVYMYLFTKVLPRAKKEVPEELRKETLSNYQMGLLRELKEWLWRQRVKAREERGRAERRKARAEAEVKAPKQFVFPGLKGGE